MTYPRETGFQAGSATSEAAARHLDETGTADSQLQEVLDWAWRGKYHGVTADEVRLYMLADWPTLHNSIVSARLARLVNTGSVVKTTRTRKASTGRDQTVYVHRDFADMETPKPLQSATAKKDFLKEIHPVLVAMLCALDAGKIPRIEPGGPFHMKLKEHIQ